MNDVMVQGTLLEHDDFDRSIRSIAAKEMLVVVLRRELDCCLGRLGVGVTRSSERFFPMNSGLSLDPFQ
jgi:hypothetical protein